ncbi:MAG: DUF4431 domain-containing protein [Deltaproteobacteria bacterium]|nr:DUF4431 domain-containing protein [Deltaproteobacteria bacterium]
MKNNLIRQILLMLVFIAYFLVFTGEAKSGECLSYGPMKVKLAGTIVRKTFPGPPNYDSIEKGDEPETYWILKLTKPVCVKGKHDDELNSETEKGIKNIHLVLDSGKYARYKHLVSKIVIAEGMLFHAHTGHHRTKVLMEVDSIKPAK